jgi:predicted NBD/HSP70 family sugar kinase
MCRCGLPNCVEALAGGAAIADQGTELARSGQSRVLAAVLDERGSLTAADVGAAAAMGDPVAADLIARSGQLVGEVISGLVNFFNPSMIVVGGGVSRAGSQFLAAIRGTVYGRSLALATHDLEIRLSALGTAAGVTGASAMVLDEIFSPKHLAAWINDGNPVKAQLALSI